MELKKKELQILFCYCLFLFKLFCLWFYLFCFASPPFPSPPPLLFSLPSSFSSSTFSIAQRNEAVLLLWLDPLEYVLVLLGWGRVIGGNLSTSGWPSTLHVASLPTLAPCPKSKSIFPLRNPASSTSPTTTAQTRPHWSVHISVLILARPTKSSNDAS